MTASFRAGSAVESYTSPTVTKTKPAGVVAGDIVFAAFATNDASRVMNTMAEGFSLVANVGDATSPGGRMWITKKKAGEDEPASYDFTFNYEFNGLTAIWSVKDGDDVSAVGEPRTDAPLSHPYSIQANAIDVPDDNSLLIWVGGQRVTTTGVDPVITQPAGFDLRIDGGVAWDPTAIFVADKVQATAGTSGTANGSASRAGAGNGRSFGVLLAVSPAGGGSTIIAAGEPMLPVITSVAAATATVSLAAGNYADVTLTVTDQDGDPIRHLDGGHDSSALEVSTAVQLDATDAAGRATLRITGVGPGSSTITCDFGGVTRTISVNVVSISQPVVRVTPAAPRVPVGGAVQFSATDDTGAALSVVWTVQSGGGTISVGGLYTAPATAGAATVRAALSGDTNTYAETQVEIYTPTTTTVSTTWRVEGTALANQPLDYIVKSGVNAIIAQGTGMTNGSGVLVVDVPASYSGQKLVVQVENVGADGSTEGRFYGTQVPTAA